MNGIVLQVGTLDEYLEELRIDGERLMPKIVRAHVQMAPAPVDRSLAIKKGMEPQNKRHIWLVSSAIMVFGADPASYYIIRLEVFTGEYWLSERKTEEKNGYSEALEMQKLIKKFCEVQGWQFRSGLWRYQNEQV
jgi:hypothetical protein